MIVSSYWCVPIGTRQWKQINRTYKEGPPTKPRLRLPPFTPERHMPIHCGFAISSLHSHYFHITSTSFLHSKSVEIVSIYCWSSVEIAIFQRTYSEGAIWGYMKMSAAPKYFIDIGSVFLDMLSPFHVILPFLKVLDSLHLKRTLSQRHHVSKKMCIFAADLDASMSNRCKKAFVKGHSWNLPNFILIENRDTDAFAYLVC